MPKRTIFLASSAELKADRDAFRQMVSELNAGWKSRGLEFEVDVWENFLDSMEPGGLQGRYNQRIRASDIFVMLFFTKVGPYTREEFETAVAGLEAGASPHVYTYFRNDSVLTGELGDGTRSLLDFKARLKELKHYVTLYRNTEDLLYQFSRQLERLYGGDGTDQLPISASMPQFMVGEIALQLGYRQLYADTALDAAAAARMKAAVELATKEVRDALFGMAAQLRHDTWDADKSRMERTIAVFDALAASERRWHAPHGQLGYALADKRKPEWQPALDALDVAVGLRGDAVREGLYYHYCRARCLVRLDPAFPTRQAASPNTREAVVDALKQARRDIGGRWDELLEQPDSADLRAWLLANGSPRLR